MRLTRSEASESTRCPVAECRRRDGIVGGIACGTCHGYTWLPSDYESRRALDNTIQEAERAWQNGKTVEITIL